MSMNEQYSWWELITGFIGLFLEGLNELFFSAGWFIPICFAVLFIGHLIELSLSEGKEWHEHD
jgi:hypothetical protein